jgi:hypothetical protein
VAIDDTRMKVAIIHLHIQHDTLFEIPKLSAATFWGYVDVDVTGRSISFSSKANHLAEKG